MPRRRDFESVCLIGAGPIVIGQACEFDYSGVQACNALKEEGYRVVLVNSNPSTVMTDPSRADATYIEPITPDMVEMILEQETRAHPKERMVLLPTMGGQTALNVAVELETSGVLERLGIEVIGARVDSIRKAEDRLLFRQAMESQGLSCPRSLQVSSVKEALDALNTIGLPAVLRPSFTLGGTGGGIAYNRSEFSSLIQGGLAASPVHTVLVEESLIGWKEYEMEVVRDKKDNCIIVCSIENVDPMGVHTGDSVTVAPALTLTDKEYQRMREASFRVVREIGVDTGGANVQFAVDPKTGRQCVIEMNPRVSRSSALASKATGFPIAKVAAKLAVGYTLDELKNDITGVTPASFEPALDYIVTKIPRFSFEKFKEASTSLGTQMKSVGEVMAVGRSFKESLQKALRSLEQGLEGLDPTDTTSLEEQLSALATPRPLNLLGVAQAYRCGATTEQIHHATHHDPWFLEQIKELVQEEQSLSKGHLPQRPHLLALKRQGFSDASLARLCHTSAHALRTLRSQLGLHPSYKRIDTCAGEFKGLTSYMYSSYEETSDPPLSFQHQEKKVVILGSGPNRIGQGIEFDYCCVHAAYALKEAGYGSIMINCNPETVSTDYDTANTLYFEPLTEEHVLDILTQEQKSGELCGVIVQLGGQTPLRLARVLNENHIPILGTSFDVIDLAEDRERFSSFLHGMEMRQPESQTVSSAEHAYRAAQALSYPVVVRPSYVLGGHAMEILYDDVGLRSYLERFPSSFPLLIDSYVQGAAEVDVDALCDGHTTQVVALMEHMEEAGVHSGDSVCSLPPFSISEALVRSLEEHTCRLGKAMGVQGLMNVQYAIKGEDIFVLEVNPRASRTVPFAAKAKGYPIAAMAVPLMLGELLSSLSFPPPLPLMAVKAPVFPFKRFPKADVALGPQMRSTGEAMGIGDSFEHAFVKAQLGGFVRLPLKGTVFMSVKDGDKHLLLPNARLLRQQGFRLLATEGTFRFLQAHGVLVEGVNKVSQGRPHIVDAMIDGQVDLVFNTTQGARSAHDSSSIRHAAVLYGIPYYTTMAGCRVVSESICALKERGLEVRSLQSYARENVLS